MTGQEYLVELQEKNTEAAKLIGLAQGIFKGLLTDNNSLLERQHASIKMWLENANKHYEVK